MGAQRFWISLWVFNSISHKCAQWYRRKNSHLRTTMYYFVYYINIKITTTVPKISKYSLKDTCCRGHASFRNVSENSEYYRNCKDFRGRSEDVSIIHQQIEVQFKCQTWYQIVCHRYNGSEITIILHVFDNFLK